MSLALAFDIYGTLIDPHGVVQELRKHIGERAPEFSIVWREKQLEYTWRRALMGRYENFAVCTRQALDYADQLLQTDFDETVKTSLMQVYRVLPAYADVPDGLRQLHAAGMRLFGFSNGLADAVSGLLEHAGIDEYFEGVISVDTLQTFKPDPVVYRHFIEVADTDPADCWLISSNGFDVIGARAVGMNAAWVQRSETVVFDPWGIEPSLVIGSLDQLFEKINQ